MKDSGGGGGGEQLTNMQSDLHNGWDMEAQRGPSSQEISRSQSKLYRQTDTRKRITANRFSTCLDLHVSFVIFFPPEEEEKASR